MATNLSPFLMPQEAVFSWKLLSVRSARICSRDQGKQPARWDFFWARNAIFHGLKALKISPGARILVPAYICKAALEPIAAYGAEPVFYEVQRNCLPDFADIKCKLCAETEALLVVHYFGFPQKMKPFRDFCDRHRLKLIEDCAHVLCGEVDGQPLGTYGDISVFSWRKFFPLQDGGELQLNFSTQQFNVDWQPESVLLNLKAMKRSLSQAIEQSRSNALKAVWKSLAPWVRWTSRGVVPELNLGLIESTSTIFDPELVNQRMTWFSRLVFTHSDRLAVIHKRQQNYRFLQEELKSLRGITPLFPRLLRGTCPWVFPVFFDGLPNAHLALREKGVPAVAWEGVRPIGIAHEEFPGADFLYENLVFLPVHQSLTEGDLQKVVEIVGVFSKGRA